MTTSAGLAASILCAPLIDGPRQQLWPVHQSPLAWQLATADGRVAMCVMKPAAIRLPHAVIVPDLPGGSPPLSVGDGTLGWGRTSARISRWWRPARPVDPRLGALVDRDAAAAFAVDFPTHLGRGDGLTPYADDVVCGALLLLRASRHRLADEVARRLLALDLERRTTATSAALLRLAAEGYCIDPVADFLARLATDPRDTAVAETALMSVGHSSGRGLLEGIRLVTVAQSEGAAA